MRHHILNRRRFVQGATALVASPAIAQQTPWAALADAADGLDQLHAVKVAKSGEGVYTQVFRGPAEGRVVPIKSVSKTIVAALTGAALDRGEIPAITATLEDLAPGLIPDAADPRTADITIENLVTMQAGLERTSGGNYGAWVSSRNLVADALSRPIVAEPGSRMLYSTGSFHILGAVLSEISGKSLLTLARERLGTPLGIEIPAWTRDPQGRYLGGNEMALTLDGMIRFGELYRQQGAIGGTRVLSKDWVSTSFQPQTRSPFSGLSYGYGWFLGRADGADFALARGYGGQIICVVPDRALTIAITSDPLRPARSEGYFGDLMALLEDRILPAARNA